MVDVKYPVPFEEGLFTENTRETKKIVKNSFVAFRLSKTNRVNPDQDSSNICRDMQARPAYRILPKNWAWCIQWYPFWLSCLDFLLVMATSERCIRCSSKKCSWKYIEKQFYFLLTKTGYYVKVLCFEKTFVLLLLLQSQIKVEYH